MKQWYSLKEAAREIGVGYETVRHLAKIGELKARRRGFGKRSPIYLPREEVERAKAAYKFV